MRGRRRAKARFLRDDQRATLVFDARGDTVHAVINALQARMPSGTLDAKGDVRWSPALAWQLDASLAGFDPGYFVPSFPGRVKGKLTTRGNARSDGQGFDATLDAPSLRGTLRGRALDARAKVALHGSEVEGDVALSLGGSRASAKGRVGATLAVDARFEPLRLDDLMPGAGGVLRGTASLRGPRATPDIEADLTGEAPALGRLPRGIAARERQVAVAQWQWRACMSKRAMSKRGWRFRTWSSMRAARWNAFRSMPRRTPRMAARRLSGDAVKRGAQWGGTLVDAAPFADEGIAVGAAIVRRRGVGTAATARCRTRACRRKVAVRCARAPTGRDVDWMCAQIACRSSS